MKTLCICLFILSGGPNLLEAQAIGAKGAPPPLPEGPILKLPGANSRWIITVTGGVVAGADTRGAGQAFMQKISVVQSGDIRMEESVGASGAKSQSWFAGGYRVTIRSGSKYPLVTKEPEADPGQERDAAGEYPGFEWVAPGKYVGPERVKGGGIHLLFKDDATESSAAVDAVSRLPVYSKIAGETYTYQFLGPAGGLSLPAEVKNAIAENQARYDRLSRRAGSPR